MSTIKKAVKKTIKKSRKKKRVIPVPFTRMPDNMTDREWQTALRGYRAMLKIGPSALN